MRVVVDIGAGIRPQSFFLPELHVCIEPFRPYIERLREAEAPNSPLVYLNCTGAEGLALFPDQSVDTVFALDVIEHLAKEDGLALLREAERVAREQVVVYTPLGYFEQLYDDSGAADRWGMDGGTWQTHRSGWTPDDFPGSWDFICCRQFHFLDQREQLLKEPVGAFWAFRNVGPRSRDRVLRRVPLRERIIDALAERTRPARRRLSALTARRRQR